MAESFALAMDGHGGAVPLDPAAVAAGQGVPPEGEFCWVHVQQVMDEPADWLTDLGGDASVHSALLAEETRPRCTVHADGILMNMRGVNLNPGAEPEDMVSVRIWATARLVVTVTRRRAAALDDLAERCLAQAAPLTPADMIARLALRLADRTEPVVAELNERIDDLEDEVEAAGAVPSRRVLADIRRVSIMLRRYMFPQRDALSTLEIEDMPWIGQPDRSRLREATERVTRLAEDLDAIRDRAQVVHDQIMDQRAEAMNRQMLLLSVVTAIFLPLGLITGLLGINVGGLPGAQNPFAFWVVCALLLATGAALLWVFRRAGWIGNR